LSAEPTPTVRPPETAGLRRLIRVIIALTGTFAVLMAASWAVSATPTSAGRALVDTSAVVAAAVAGLCYPGTPDRAVTVVTVGILSMAILLAAIPPATPALAALPLVSGSIALSTCPAVRSGACCG